MWASCGAGRRSAATSLGGGANPSVPQGGVLVPPAPPPSSARGPPWRARSEPPAAAPTPEQSEGTRRCGNEGVSCGFCWLAGGLAAGRACIRDCRLRGKTHPPPNHSRRRLLWRWRFTPFAVFVLFGITGTLAEASAFGLQSLANFGLWIFVYGLMVWLPAHWAPPERSARVPRWWAYPLATIAPFFFMPLLFLLAPWRWLTAKHPPIHFPPIR